MPAMTLMARPVWNSTSPISTNRGMGVSEKLMTESTLLRTTWASPTSPPRNSQAPRILTATNDKATGMPRNRSSVEPPSSRRAASCQDMDQRASDACKRTAVMTRTRGPCGCCRLISAGVRMAPVLLHILPLLHLYALPTICHYPEVDDGAQDRSSQCRGLGLETAWHAPGWSGALSPGHSEQEPQLGLSLHARRPDPRHGARQPQRCEP